MPCRCLLGRIRAEALERAYPEVVVHAPVDHPAMAIVRESGGRVVDAEEWEGQCSMYHVPDVGGFLKVDPARPGAAARGRRGSPCRWRWA